MGKYFATVRWSRNEDGDFAGGDYSRAHTWEFDGGITVPASASPHVVNLPFSREDAVDPEEAFVASIASCHMLSFLWVAARQGFVVESYSDEARGVMRKNEQGRVAVTKVWLAPCAEFSGEHRPDDAQLEAMHHEAHEVCFIANSVRTEIICTPVNGRA